MNGLQYTETHTDFFRMKYITCYSTSIKKNVLHQMELIILIALITSSWSLTNHVSMLYFHVLQDVIQLHFLRQKRTTILI